MSTTVPVRLPDSGYDIVVGAGVLDALDDHLPVPTHATRVALVTNATVGELHGASAAAALERLGLGVETIEVPDGEQAKSLDTLAMLYHRFAAMPLRRDDLVAALGGGVVGDLAGFAAATWHRGVAVAQLPTTVLAQVDAAIGGKTGVNLPEGKNLVGAFHQPRVVLADTATLSTLPARELRAGLGEAVKHGFIADPRVLELLEERPDDAVAGDPEVLTELVVRGAAVKARIVAADEREAGERALLNYGHTIGHAIEALTDYARYRHGEAVALGMVAAARVGESMGMSQPGLTERTVALLDSLGLPTGGLRLDPAGVWEALGRDKKARGGVRMVLCREPGVAELVSDPTRAQVDAAVAALAR
ncbi:3-dehydroquinate synthase [Egibacter rhizosphaerae]|uniref:3-dehydroquinate synthase n=1 Tax=Egibacter rhizosphaerae TaxID=1670831 RepID=A0A411YJZ4_9ACTN|nr:3-dehydroquinate synthase [Egibacter rhizosphaerae]QBI21528.1 3-dehydroquinate synthase [Egibacter rhizosphaerae]